MTPESKKPASHWILLRGLARESRHWGTFPQDLQASLNSAFEQVHVDCLDLPGAGRFSEMRCPISIPEIAEFVRNKFLELRQRMREQGQTPPNDVYLVSVSLGGMVATHWLQQWSEDFKGAVLINTSFKGFSPVHHRLRLSAYLRLANAIRCKTPVEREIHVLKLVSNKPECYARVAAEWAEIQMDRPVSLENFTRQLLAAARYVPLADVPPQPVLILNSWHDRMVNPACSIEIAKRWKAEIRQHPTAGHELPLDDAAWVLDQIRSWLARFESTRD